LEACEPIHCNGLEHNLQIVCHDTSVAAFGPNNGSVACEPLLGVDMTVVWLNTEDLEVRQPLYGPQSCREISWAVDVGDNGDDTSSRLSVSIGSWLGGVSCSGSSIVA
jgi:hypothetical protein